jgi:hypothetical protein
MALADVAAFRASFPEFVQVEDAQIQVFLDRAATSVPLEPWDDHQHEGHLYLTAHLLASSPYGQNARLDPKSDVTTYGAHYSKLQLMVAAGPRVV